MGDNSVQVALRIRPLVQSERDRGCQSAVEHTKGLPQVVVNRSDAFTFNYVFDEYDAQEQVYSKAVLRLLDKIFGGFNATILAYGQTGSGKTHTMGTAFDGELNDDVGVIPRAIHDIFERIAKLSGECEFVVTCSFMELYQEQLFDLLSTKPREQSIIEMREDRSGIIMPDLTEEVVRSARETTDCLLRGSSGRCVAATAMNQQSSRSHAIFTVTLQATKNNEMRTVTTSKFHLVDLAGSERSKKTQATGDRFKEGVKINQGLLALGNVISALGSGQGSGFVRYRDSKLTRLLQDSLGGNSHTLMIACISPADYNVPETLSTLRYADRARKIKNKPIINQDPHAAEINHLKSIIQKLRMELLSAGAGMSSSLTGALQNVVPTNANAAAPMPEVQANMYKQLQEKCHNLQQHLQVTLHDVAENEMRAHIAEAAHEKLKAKTDEVKSVVGDLARDCTEAVTPEQLQLRVQQIQKLVDNLDEELERTQTEIHEHKRRCSNASTIDGNDDTEDGVRATQEMHAMMQEQADAFTNKQMDFKEQLRRINRELNLKEELQQRVAGNLNKFCTLDDNIEEKFKDCESKIQELEAEKSELLDKLRHVKQNASAKLAEERRKRLQTLEQEINEMKRKNIQQAKLLKVREKETQKIKNLNSEIQVMKESKVKLIRAMRQESENFRQWKLTREKELMQLRNKDRKMQNEMARKEAMHTKQRNVLKRKCEEAMAINKRLKDALERQHTAQSQRHKKDAKDGGNSKVEQLVASVERELEVIISVIDAEHTLEQLMEDRGMISSRIGELEQQQQEPNTTAATNLQDELSNLKEELEMRNAQIADLQPKVCAIDIETRMQTLYSNVQNLSEARTMLKQLLKSICEMRREFNARSLEQKAAIEEQRALRETAEQLSATAAKRMRLMEIEHEEAIAERENTYEEKIAVLLRELHNASQLTTDGAVLTPEQEERLKIQEEQLNRMDAMREELEDYKRLVNELQQAVNNQKKRVGATKSKAKTTPAPIIEDLVEIFTSDDEADFDADSSDPDWVKTPLLRKAARSTSSRGTKQNSLDGSSAVDDTYATASSQNTAHAAHNATTASSTNEHKCRCRGTCSNKRCGCFLNSEQCTISCFCGSDCRNGKPIVKKEKHDDDDNVNATAAEEKDEVTTVEPENNTLITEHNKAMSPPTATASTSTSNDNTFIKPEAFMTPKIARLSTISFDTPSAKKKFFN